MRRSFVLVFIQQSKEERGDISLLNGGGYGILADGKFAVLCPAVSTQMGDGRGMRLKKIYRKKV